MRWIRLKDRKPDAKIDGEKLLLYRLVNASQESIAISIHDTQMVKFCSEDETWWMPLPEKPVLGFPVK
jgi:hypothetical protein